MGSYPFPIYPSSRAAVVHTVKNIVSVGADDQLVWLRDAVLQSAGFAIFNTSDEEVALARVSQRGCDILLLYNRLPAVAIRLAAGFRKRCPDGQIVVVSNKAMEKPDFADALHYRVDGPEALIDLIRG